jgi:hypothetical protein
MNTMKKLQIFLGLGAIGLALLLNSCSDTTTHAVPTITYDATSPITLDAGVDAATLTGTIVAEAKLKQVTVYKTVGLSESLLETITDFESGEITTTDDINYSFRIDITGITEETTIKITALDKDDQEASQSIVIQVTLGNPVTSHTGVVLGAQGNTTLGSSCDLDEGDVYKVAEARTNASLVDAIYVWDISGISPVLAAPIDAAVNTGGIVSWCSINWSPKNDTKFKATDMTTAEFDAVEYDAAITAITGINDTKIVDFAANDVIAFETDGGKKGLIKVTAISGTEAGTLTFDIKIQQ